MGIIWMVSDNPELAAQLVGGARAFSGEDKIHIVTFNEKSAQNLAQLGADRIYQINSSDNRPETAIQVIADLIKKDGASAVIFGATPRGRGMAASMAARLDSGLASETIAIKRDGDNFIADRYIYGGNGIASVTFNGTPCFTVSPGVFMEAEKKGSPASEIIVVDVAPDPRIEMMEKTATPRESADIAKAKRIVCFGRGVDRQEDLQMINELANLVQGEVGCSRGMAEDLKWLPLDRYIGISGAKVQPEIHFSIGVSGQVQHVAGIREAKVIVAVDKNENAPIFQIADYGIVGDLYEVVPELNRVLKS